MNLEEQKAAIVAAAQAVRTRIPTLSVGRFTNKQGNPCMWASGALGDCNDVASVVEPLLPAGWVHRNDENLLQTEEPLCTWVWLAAPGGEVEDVEAEARALLVEAFRLDLPFGAPRNPRTLTEAAELDKRARDLVARLGGAA